MNVPECWIHAKPMKIGRDDTYYCAEKMPDGHYCQERAHPLEGPDPEKITIKRHIGKCELNWTFRANSESLALEKAERVIRHINKMAEAGRQPANERVCPIHQTPMTKSEYDNGYYCAAAMPDGYGTKYCGVKVN